jgi:hypothetical protein
MSVAAGELAKVLRIPPRPQPDPRVGQVGLVLTGEGDLGMIVFLKPNGDTDGAMFLPLDCLEAVNDPTWAKALAEYRRQQQQAEFQAYYQRLERQQKIEMVADKYQLTVDAVLEIAAVVTGEETRGRYY